MALRLEPLGHRYANLVRRVSSCSRPWPERCGSEPQGRSQWAPREDSKPGPPSRRRRGHPCACAGLGAHGEFEVAIESVNGRPIFGNEASHEEGTGCLHDEGDRDLLVEIRGAVDRL